MNKQQLLDAINAHPSHSAESLHSHSQGSALTNEMLFDYLCELENWHPLEVKKSSHPDWYLVASKSEIGTWHKTNFKHQACDCLRTNNNRCAHLWAAKAKFLGFDITYKSGIYYLTDNTKPVAEVTFKPGQCIVKDQKHSSLFRNGDEAIEYLSAVASFGIQLG
jgi:hypothetical protein